MADTGKTIRDGLLLSLLASLFLVALLRFNPRLLLQDYPEAIQAKVPPKTAAEKRQSLLVGLPFLLLLVAVPFLSTWARKRQAEVKLSFRQLFLNAFGVAFMFNLVDLLLLDWLIFSFLTPDFLVIPGTEGMAAYKDYAYHFRASIVGTVVSIVAGLGVAVLVWLL